MNYEQVPEIERVKLAKERRKKLLARAEVNHDEARECAIKADMHVAAARDLAADMNSLASIAHSLNALVALKLREVE